MQETRRKRYVKPQIAEVRLVAQEAVLGTCKFQTGQANRYQCDPDPNCLSSQYRS